MKARYIYVPLLAGLMAVAGLWFVAGRYSDWPHYEASATLLIENTPDSNEVGMTSQGIAIAQNTLAALLVRDPALSNVIDETGVPLSAKALADKVRVRPTRDAPLIEIRVTDPDPELAARLANAMAVEAVGTPSVLVSTSVLSPAVAPTTPTLGGYILLAVAGVVGSQVGAGALVVGRRLSRRIRSVDDIRERSHYPLLGELSMRGTDADPSDPTDRVVVAAFASGVDADAARLLVMSATESKQVARVVVLLGAVFSKLAGEDRVVRDVVRDVSLGNGERSPIETVVVSYSVEDPDGARNDFRRWVKTLRPLAPVGRSIPGGPGSIGSGRDDTDRSVHVIQSPPLLANAEIVLTIAEHSSVVLVVERNTTRIRDFELAVDFLVRSGVDVLGVFLVG